MLISEYFANRWRRRKYERKTTGFGLSWTGCLI
jgi:hypothetical protein